MDVDHFKDGSEALEKLAHDVNIALENMNFVFPNLFLEVNNFRVAFGDWRAENECRCV